MKDDFFYGNDYDSFDGDASDKSGPATSGPQENVEVTEDQPHLDIWNARSYQSKYIFYFSSKL